MLKVSDMKPGEVPENEIVLGEKMKKINKEKQLKKAINLATKYNSSVLNVRNGYPSPEDFVSAIIKINDILCDFKTGGIERVVYIKPKRKCSRNHDQKKHN
jgi:hypothetical protein